MAHLLAASAEKYPEHLAIRHQGVDTTYRQLADRVALLADSLSRRGVGPGSRVAVLLDKGPAASSAIFAVLALGAAYVPLDPTSPPRRLRIVLDDCGIGVLVSTPEKARELLAAGVPETLEAIVLWGAEGTPDAATEPTDLEARSGLGAKPVLGEFPPTKITVIDPNGVPPASRAAPGAAPGDLATILYTSGSTGRPKGVMISHRAALAFVHWCVDTFELRNDDRVAAVAALHFDLSIFDLFATVAVGASYHPLPPFALLRPSEARQWIEDEALTVWYSTPSTLRLLLDRGDLEARPTHSLRRVLFAGEVFPIPALRRLRVCLPDAQLYNLYGPTESNVCTIHQVDTLPPNDSGIPLGHACAGTEVEVFDAEGRPVAEGEVGELWVRGPTLMDGYWGAPESTARVLGPHPLHPADDAPWLRTGDLAHRDAEGRLHFHGRRDHMVKVRGYRVELGEVEAALAGHPELEAAVVVPIETTESPEVRLRAWVVPRQAPVSTLALKLFLGERLPPYMIPAEFRSLDDLPETSTGKVDRRALAARTD